MNRRSKIEIPNGFQQRSKRKLIMLVKSLGANKYLLRITPAAAASHEPENGTEETSAAR